MGLTCGNCEFWGPEAASFGHRVCHNEKVGGLAAAYPDGAHADFKWNSEKIATGASFGCIHHQPK